jgi:hypothetical protein
MGVKAHIFLTSALVVGEWSALYHGHFTPSIHWIGGCMGPRTGLDDMEKNKFLALPRLELLPLCYPAHVQSLYWQCCPDSTWYKILVVLTKVLHAGLVSMVYAKGLKDHNIVYNVRHSLFWYTKLVHDHNSEYTVSIFSGTLTLFFSLHFH